MYIVMMKKPGGWDANDFPSKTQADSWAKWVHDCIALGTTTITEVVVVPIEQLAELWKRHRSNHDKSTF